MGFVLGQSSGARPHDRPSGLVLLENLREQPLRFRRVASIEALRDFLAPDALNEIGWYALPEPVNARSRVFVGAAHREDHV